MKRLIRIISAVLVAAVLFVGGIFVGYNVEREIPRERLYMMLFELGDSFEDNKSSFLDVAQKALAVFDEKKAQNAHTRSVTLREATENRWEATVRLSDGTFYQEYSEMTENESRASAAVTKAWGGTYYADAGDNQVSFHDGRLYTIVYTENGKEPSLSSTWKEQGVFMECLGFRWYQVALNQLLF